MALNLDFVRQDYHSLGPCMRNTMKVLAQGKHVSPCKLNFDSRRVWR